LHLHPHVELPCGSCTRVPEGGDGGVDRVVHDVAVERDLDQVQKGPRPTLPAKASPGSLTPIFLNLCNYLAMFVHLRSGIELKP
jgi:hypothetical protein